MEEFISKSMERIAEEQADCEAISIGDGVKLFP